MEQIQCDAYMLRLVGCIKQKNETCIIDSDIKPLSCDKFVDFLKTHKKIYLMATFGSTQMVQKNNDTTLLYIHT